MELNFSSFFTAAILCPVLIAPINGDVDVPSREVDSTATYSCDDGFILSGLQTRACQSNGRWFGIPPICTPGKKKYYCALLHIIEPYVLILWLNFQSCILNSSLLFRHNRLRGTGRPSQWHGDDHGDNWRLYGRLYLWNWLLLGRRHVEEVSSRWSMVRKWANLLS